MNKKIFVINGSGGVGKDTFVQYLSDWLSGAVTNYSSVEYIKTVATDLGWKGGKSETDRKFLSDLKDLSSEYNDLPFTCMKETVDSFLNDENDKILFLHIREPKEIERAKLEFGAKTILVKNKNVAPVKGNSADENVEKYNYDIIIHNDGTISDLKEMALQFYQECLLNKFRHEWKVSKSN